MAVDNEGHRHKAGPLKQQNKQHKRGRHRSNREIESQNKGRVSVKILSKKSHKQIGKLNRRNQARQIRGNKREEVLELKRKTGKYGSPPHIIAIVPLSSNCDAKTVLKLLTECDEEAVVYSNSASTTIVSRQLKQRFTFLPLQYGDLYPTLDAMKVADTVMFVMTADRPLDTFGDKCLSCVFAQGLPTSFHILQGLEKIPTKKRNEVKKNIQKLVEKRFPKGKLHTVENSQDGIIALRLISNLHQRSLFFRDHRPHLLAQHVTYEHNTESEGVAGGTLKVSGFIRGTTLSVNRLIHIPGWGSFQMLQIDSPTDPFPWQVKKRVKSYGQAMALDCDPDDESTAMEEDIKVLAKAEASQQESLDSEVIPDPMEGEQTWPTEEELRAAEAECEDKTKTVKRVPKGTSEYQASWIIDSDEERRTGEESEYDSDDDGDSILDDVKDESDSDESMKADNEDYETISLAATETEDSKYDERIDLSEEKEILEKLRAERENEMFPDEVDTPMDVPARVRFQRFRGLKSFRTSPWDPKENLPSDYSRIFQFENFTRTKKRILSEDFVDGAMAGWYVTVHIACVPQEFMDSYNTEKPLVLFGLLPHEQKMSVLHFVIRRHKSFNEPVKSKEQLVFHCGYRRFSACPVFSQHTSGSKFKYERFLPKDDVTVATVYAPITLPPCPVMVFRSDKNSAVNLVATGSLYKVDPNRIITKKIVLSGHPFKINKRSAVVRYMFFNRDDIMWFKPVELFTKHGRRGHIKEPLGTHGHMKCTFDGSLKAQDTVCMNLYKRVFPKWSYEAITQSPPPETADLQEEISMED